MNRRLLPRADPGVRERMGSDTALRCYLEAEPAEEAVEKLEAAIREEAAQRTLRVLPFVALGGVGLALVWLMLLVDRGALMGPPVGSVFALVLIGLCGSIAATVRQSARLRAGVALLSERAVQCSDPGLLGTLLRMAARVEKGVGSDAQFERETLAGLSKVCTRLFRGEGAAIWLDQDERDALGVLLEAAVHEHLTAPSRPAYGEEFLVSAVLMAADLEMRECRGAILQLERHARTIRVREVCLAYLHALRLPVPGVPLP